MILRVRYDELDPDKVLVTALEVLDHQIYIYFSFFSLESFRKNSDLRYVLHVSEELKESSNLAFYVAKPFLVGFLVITDDVNLNEMIELIKELDPFKQFQPVLLFGDL
jgi:hypothetical protein